MDNNYIFEIISNDGSIKMYANDYKRKDVIEALNNDDLYIFDFSNKVLKKISLDHEMLLDFKNENSYIKLLNENVDISLNLKVFEYNIYDDLIEVVYSINDTEKFTFLIKKLR